MNTDPNDRLHTPRQHPFWDRLCFTCGEPLYKHPTPWQRIIGRWFRRFL